MTGQIVGDNLFQKAQCGKVSFFYGVMLVLLTDILHHLIHPLPIKANSE